MRHPSLHWPKIPFTTSMDLKVLYEITFFPAEGPCLISSQYDDRHSLDGFFMAKIDQLIRNIGPLSAGPSSKTE